MRSEEGGATSYLGVGWVMEMKSRKEWIYAAMILQVDQVCKIVEVLGVPPSHVLERASRTEKFFEKGPGGNWILRRPRDGRKVGGAL